jgi:hypothetical protein
LGFYILKKIIGKLKRSIKFKSKKLDYNVIEIENISLAMDKTLIENIYPYSLNDL